MFTTLILKSPSGSIKSSTHMTCEVSQFRMKISSLGYIELCSKTCDSLQAANVWGDYLERNANKQSLDNQLRAVLNG